MKRRIFFGIAGMPFATAMFPKHKPALALPGCPVEPIAFDTPPDEFNLQLEEPDYSLTWSLYSYEHPLLNPGRFFVEDGYFTSPYHGDVKFPWCAGDKPMRKDIIWYRHPD